MVAVPCPLSVMIAVHSRCLGPAAWGQLPAARGRAGAMATLPVSPGRAPGKRRLAHLGACPWSPGDDATARRPDDEGDKGF
jgi:hypothetical protein